MHRHLKDISGNSFMAALITVCILLDISDVWGRTHAVGALGGFACSVLPFAKVAALLFSHRSVEFVDARCLGQIGEPAISIIFFMFKLSIAIVAILPTIAIVYLFNTNLFFKARNKRVELCQKNGLLHEIKKYLTGFTLPLIICFIAFGEFSLFKAPEQYPANLFHKIIEDYIVGFTFMVLLSLPIHIILFGLCAVHLRKLGKPS